MNSWIKKDCFSYYHRSSIIYETDKQKTIAEEKIKEVNKEKLFESDVTTKLIKYIADQKTFKIAPESDCNYYNKNPNDGFSKSIILPKLEKINEQFSTLYNI